MTLPSNARRILLIEDDPALAMGLSDALEFEGFRVTHAKSGRMGIDRARAESPDCVILDLMLPDINGYDVCAELRRSNVQAPILMLTARSQEADKIRGLESGADDYLTKPFSLGELVARIRAMLRRTQRTEAPPPADELRIGDALIHVASQTLTRHGKEHRLSFHELELLRLLHERAGRVVPREEILERVWSVDGATSTRTVDNTVVKLRKKLEPADGSVEYILTVYGVGYKLVLAGVPAEPPKDR